MSAIYILDLRGRVIISRDYRGDAPVKCIENFTKFLNEDDGGTVTPFVSIKGITYCYVTHSNLILMIVARKNVNAAFLISFLHRLKNVLEEYFEVLEEESLRDNFAIVYELLDEVMDFGFPQFTEAKILQEFIKTDAYRMEVEPPQAVTNKVSWRSEGLVYKKNEVFLDVIESVNLIINSTGNVVRSEVQGVLKMRTYLSGMPICKLGLNDKVLLEKQGRSSRKTIDLDDIKFHQCVQLNAFESDRTIAFIPPDGAFDLMTYRLAQDVKPLILVESMVEKHGRGRTEYLVKARSLFKERTAASQVEIALPMPPDAITPVFKMSQGSCTYQPEKERLVWKLKSFPGGREYMLRAKFSQPSVVADGDTGDDRRPPIQVKFEVPYFTVSGIQVRYLKVVEKSGYQALPWVRYITRAGSYEVRIQ